MNPDRALLREVLRRQRAGDWQGAHDRVQADPSMLAAWLHALLHLEEGDLEDAEHWYGRAGRAFRQRGTLAQELAAFEAALEAAPPPRAPGA